MAEMYLALPEIALTSLATRFTEILITMEIPESWTDMSVTLVPKL